MKNCLKLEINSQNSKLKLENKLTNSAENTCFTDYIYKLNDDLIIDRSIKYNFKFKQKYYLDINSEVNIQKINYKLDYFISDFCKEKELNLIGRKKSLNSVSDSNKKLNSDLIKLNSNNLKLNSYTNINKNRIKSNNETLRINKDELIKCSEIFEIFHIKKNNHITED